MPKKSYFQGCPCPSLTSGLMQLQTFNCRTQLTRRSNSFHFCLAATGLRVRGLFCVQLSCSRRVCPGIPGFVSLALNWQLAQGVTPPSPSDGWDRLQQQPWPWEQEEAGRLIRIRSVHHWLFRVPLRFRCLDVLGHNNRKTLSGDAFNTKASPAVHQRVVIKERKRQQIRLQQSKMSRSHREAKKEN